MKNKDFTAVINVDVLNDFYPKGALGIATALSISGPINEINAWAIKNKLLLVFTIEDHDEDSEHFKKWPVHGVKNSWGSQIHKSIVFPEGHAIRVYKGSGKKDDGYSGFEGKTRASSETLDQLLKQFETETLIVTGLATDWCVRATVLDALKLGYKVYVISDAIDAVNIKPEDGANAISEMKAAGAIFTTTKEVTNENV